MVTDLERAEIFRECYSVGRGYVTPEIFFTVVTERNFFIRFLRLRGEVYTNNTTN